MAGRQFSGLKYSTNDMFVNATMVMVTKEDEDLYVLGRTRELLRDAGFKAVTLTTAEKHDEMIAFTSQLAHVVSNAYVKSPTARAHHSFSAGSYRDLTRVAKLNETMWTELFMDNADYLGNELDWIIWASTATRSRRATLIRSRNCCAKAANARRKSIPNGSADDSYRCAV